MSEKSDKPRHITRGNVLDDLGFPPAEAAALKIKAKILNALLERIRQRHLTQNQLAQVLDEYQPNVSNLLNGKISKMSIEKLLYYGDRLSLNAEINLKPKPRSIRQRKTRVA